MVTRGWRWGSSDPTAKVFAEVYAVMIFKFKSSLKTSAIAFHAVVLGVHEAPEVMF